jgi:hypothetical protein
MFVSTKALLLSISPKSSPTSVATNTDVFADKETLFEFVISAECTDIDSINKRFRSKLEREQASLMFDICKNEDSKCIFAAARKEQKWSAKQLRTLVRVHVVTLRDPHKNHDCIPIWHVTSSL